MMKNLIFDLENEGSTYTQVNTVVWSATCVIFSVFSWNGSFADELRLIWL